MAKISSYGEASNPQLTDRLIGTEVNADPKNDTKNFTIDQLLNLLGGGDKGAVLNLPSFIDDAAAGAAGLVAGQLWSYSTAVGSFVMVKE